ncbi:MAG TPA: NADH-dependent alcohol dehydrogenase, partial [Sutterella sp.]|nr:NADH-dependent alcohol dehydrogenase [Sutterella sp.]
MLDFTYCNPTKLMFGRSMEGEIGRELAALPESPKRALIVYGGGSAVRSGLLDLVRNSL